MKLKKYLHKFLYVVAAFIMAVFAVFQSVSFCVAHADEVQVKNYDLTKILDDLSDVSTISYPKNTAGAVDVVRFQEYCFAYSDMLSDYYGLYLYIYNPTEKPFLEAGKNYVNIAVAYDGENPIEYANMRLTFLDKTDNNRFYKFKVTDSAKLLETARVQNDTYTYRRYDVAGFTFVHTDGSNLITEQEDVSISKTYYFSGYSAGCNPAGSVTDEESTLTCSYKSLETLKLKVNHANYRTEDYNGWICDELQTAYFSVPNKYFDNYGGLQNITAEWYEYKTNPIFVTKDESAYDVFFEFLNKNIGSDVDEETLLWRVLWEPEIPGPYSYVYNKRYGYYGEGSWFLNGGSYYGWSDAENIPIMNWLFLRENAKTPSDYVVTADEVLSYMDWYTHSLFPYEERLEGKYAKSLFADSIDEDRLIYLENPTSKRGYIKQSIDAENDKQDLMFETNQSWWDRLWNGVEYEEKSYAPIVVLDSKDGIGTMTVDSFAKKYLIDKRYAEDCYDYCKTEIEKGNKAVLFRFAVTDYYSSPAAFDYDKNGISPEDGYVAQMTVFLDFDVISLGFRNSNGDEKVIPCVSNPIDIVNAVTPPPNLGGNDINWLAIILLGLGLLLFILLGVWVTPVLSIIGKVLMILIKVIWLIISLPFKLIGKLFHRNE